MNGRSAVTIQGAPPARVPALVRQAERPRVPWGARDVLKAAGVFVGLVLVEHLLILLLIHLWRELLQVVIGDLARVGLEPRLQVQAVTMVLADLALVAALWLCIVHPYHISWTLLGYRPVALRRLLLMPPAALGTVGLMALVLRVQDLLRRASLTNPQAQQVFSGVPHTSANLIVLLALLCVLTPVVEETLFRGVLYQMFVSRLGWRSARTSGNRSPWLRHGVATLGSAVLFALWHGLPVLVPCLILAGVVLAVVYEYTGSLYGSMLLHGLVNAASLMVVW